MSSNNHPIRVAMMLLNSGRGSGVVARQQARALLDRGNSVIFMHPGVGDGVAGAVNVDVKLPGATTPVHEYLPSAGDTQKAVSSMAYAEAMEYVPFYERALEEYIDDVDIVIGHHGNLVALAVANVCKHTSTSLALFLHGTGVEPRLHGGYNDSLWAEIAKAIMAADGLLVTTDYVRDHLVLPLVDVGQDRFLVLPCGIDLEEFHPNTSDEVLDRYRLPDPFVICPGALTLSKGPQNVVAASTQYADIGHTVFIGAGELQPELESQLRDRGRFLGFVSAEDKAALISNATLLVAAPEKKEHFGIIYAEALAGGTPCVAYEGGGVDSIVTPDVGVLTSRDSVSLGNEVRRLLQDGATREEMARRARERAESHFDMTTLAARLEAWLQHLIETKDND